MKTTIVSWLLYLYPKAWRAEYGDELRTMLLARPLTAATRTLNPANSAAAPIAASSAT